MSRSSFVFLPSRSFAIVLSMLGTSGDVWSPVVTQGLGWLVMSHYKIHEDVTLLETNIAIHSTWKWMVGILVSFWDGLFSGAMLVSGRVYIGPLGKQKSLAQANIKQKIVFHDFWFYQTWNINKNWPTWTCWRWFFYGLHQGIHHHHSPPFGKKYCLFFSSILSGQIIATSHDLAPKWWFSKGNGTAAISGVHLGGRNIMNSQILCKSKLWRSAFFLGARFIFDFTLVLFMVSGSLVDWNGHIMLLHPGEIEGWKLKITQIEKENHVNQTSIFWVPCWFIQGGIEISRSRWCEMFVFVLNPRTAEKMRDVFSYFDLHPPSIT